MPLEQPGEHYQFVHVPVSGVLDAVIVGEVHTWWCHWTYDREQRRKIAVRCMASLGHGCRYCSAAYERRARYLIPIEVDGWVRVIELGEPQYARLRWIQENAGWVGLRVRFRRERPTRNGVVVVELLSDQPVPVAEEVDLTSLAHRQGLDGLRRMPLPPEDLNPYAERPPRLPSEPLEGCIVHAMPRNRHRHR